MTSYVSYDDWGALIAKAVLKMGVRELDLVQEYTGYSYDMVLGVFYAKARMYDANDRRFMAVDPVKGSLANVQSMAQYTYCLDNPIKYVDPLGLTATSSNSNESWVRGYYEGQNQKVEWSAGSGQGNSTIVIKDASGKTIQTMKEGTDYYINSDGKAMMTTPTVKTETKSTATTVEKEKAEALSRISDDLYSMSAEKIYDLAVEYGVDIRSASMLESNAVRINLGSGNSIYIDANELRQSLLEGISRVIDRKDSNASLKLVNNIQSFENWYKENTNFGDITELASIYWQGGDILLEAKLIHKYANDLPSQYTNSGSVLMDNLYNDLLFMTDMAWLSMGLSSVEIANALTTFQKNPTYAAVSSICDPKKLTFIYSASRNGMTSYEAMMYVALAAAGFQSDLNLFGTRAQAGMDNHSYLLSQI